MKAAGILAVLFGALTLKAGGTVLFGSDAAREGAGHYVPFVLWFNFLAAFAYIAAGVGLWRRAPWAPPLATFIAVATVGVFAAFGIHVLLGGAFEMRTVWAMTLRSAVWIVLAVAAGSSIRRRPA